LAPNSSHIDDIRWFAGEFSPPDGSIVLEEVPSPTIQPPANPYLRTITMPSPQDAQTAMVMQEIIIAQMEPVHQVLHAIQERQLLVIELLNSIPASLNARSSQN
jgi:hypothetical protein